MKTLIGQFVRGAYQPRSMMRNLLLLATLCTWISSAFAISLPGGKANWVTAVGHLEAGASNWARLGYYTFNADGTASTNWWFWSSASEPVRIGAGFASCGPGVPACEVKTVEGFQNSPMGGFKGSYAYVSRGRVQVTWTHNADGTQLANPLTEFWYLESGLLNGKLARMRSSTFYKTDGAGHAYVDSADPFSTYSANFGIAYGSAASLANTSRATMTQLLTDPRYNSRPYRGFNPTATHGNPLAAQQAGGRWRYLDGVNEDGNPNQNNPWKLCTSGKCIGWNQFVSSCGPSCAAPHDAIKDRVLYIAEVGGGRRNTEWSWCKCLARWEECYKYNSHVRPMLQVVDDAGVFQGWVGVEASTHVSVSTGLPDGAIIDAHYGVFDMVAPELFVEFLVKRESR